MRGRPSKKSICFICLLFAKQTHQVIDVLSVKTSSNNGETREGLLVLAFRGNGRDCCNSGETIFIHPSMAHRQSNNVLMNKNFFR